MIHSIPASALQQHVVILGKTNSGKTYAAKGIVESLISEEVHGIHSGKAEPANRVCIIDPTGVWWGLKSSESGKRAAYPVAIFGGSHADFPIAGTHGEAIAEIVSTSTTTIIIDTSLMRTSERTRFFTDFAETLLRKNRGRLHLFIDEAHVFAPQGKVSDPQSGMMLHAANNLVSLGRSRGLCITLISQRPAKLHKDSLTQVETLVAMRLVAPQDRAAVLDWIKDNADQARAQEIISSLAGLKTGTGWLWAPEQGILQQIQFPRIKTFDSGRSPDGSEKSGAVLAPIDRSYIEQRLQDVAAEIVANDPARLKAELVVLRKELAKSKAAPAPDGKALEEAYQKGFNDGGNLAYGEGWRQCEEAVKTAIAQMPNGPPIINSRPSARLPVRPQPQTAKRETPSSPAPKQTPTAIPSLTRGGVLTGPEARILNAIAWLSQTTDREEVNQVAVAFLAGYTYGGGAFNNPRGALKTRGLVDYGSHNTILLTEEGKAMAVFPESACSTEELHNRILARLPGPERRVLEPLLAAYPDGMKNADLAKAANYAEGAGSFNNPRGRLKSLGLIEYVGGSSVAAAALFLD